MRPPVFYAAIFTFGLALSRSLGYMGGGDLLKLLIGRDTFLEDLTRFYIAEVQRLLFQCWMER